MFSYFYVGAADGLAGQVAGVLPPGQGGPRGGQVHPGPIAGQPHALRSVMPPFMFRGGQIPPGNYPPAGGPYPTGPGQYGPRGPGGPAGRYPPPPSQQEARYRQGVRMANPAAANQNDPDLYPRPIIKEEDLRRMDEISGDDGWAALQDEPDYDKKLFDDEPSEEQRNNGNAQQAGTPTAAAVEDEAKADRDGKWADNIQAQGRAISTPPAPVVHNRDRGVAAAQGGRHPHQQTNSRPISMDEDDFWREQQRQQKNVEIKAAQRAKEMRYKLLFFCQLCLFNRY